jgi:hypothetical protein
VAASARAPEGLYGLPLEEFTPARDALAKELKAEGRKDEAAEVKSLRKPSLAAWALNRAARDNPDAIDALRAAGNDLRAAQDEALSGDAGRLRDAGRALNDEIDRVAGLAAEALRSAGRPASATQQEKLATTLRTAAVDDEAGEILASGVLVDELDPTGFNLLTSLSGDLSVSARPASSPPSRKSSDSTRKDGEKLPGAAPKPKQTKAGKEAMEAIEAARRELRRCDAEADMTATRAHRKAERAEAAAKRAAEAQREAEEARSAAEDAAGEAEAARRRAAEAADALAAAEAALP